MDSIELCSSAQLKQQHQLLNDAIVDELRCSDFVAIHREHREMTLKFLKKLKLFTDLNAL